MDSVFSVHIRPLGLVLPETSESVNFKYPPPVVRIRMPPVTSSLSEAVVPGITPIPTCPLLLICIPLVVVLPTYILIYAFA